MKFPYKAYAGKTLWVDLSRRKVSKKNLSEDLARNYLGGSGFIAKILYDEVRKGTDPLSPNNVLVFAIGPLTGTRWPQSGRFQVGAKSPLTNIFGDASCCGFWGSELKFAGYDAIIIKGKSEKPVYLSVEDDKVKLRDAGFAWRKGTHETQEIIKEKSGDYDTQVVSIGQAGENLVRYACIMSEYRAAGRTGMGAVMGSKNLKAIAVRGSQDVEVASNDKFNKLVDKLIDIYDSSQSVKERRIYGTSVLLEPRNEVIGGCPTKNHQLGWTPPKLHLKIGGTAMKKIMVKTRACFGCRGGCEHVVKVERGPYAGIHEKHPEYESLVTLGSDLWNWDLASIIHLNELVDEYGLDSISAGKSIAFMMELYEKGIIDEKLTDGLSLHWGDVNVVEELIHKIAKREGIGDLLAEGVKRAAERIGGDAPKYAMHVKGMEISSQDGRSHKAMGLGHAVSSRGADHLKSLFALSGTPLWIEKTFGKKYLDMLPMRTETYKGLLVKYTEEDGVISDSLVHCKSMWSGVSYYGFPPWGFAELADAVTLATGMNLSGDDLQQIGERVVNLERAFNVREGITRKDDTLPKRMLEDPMPSGPAKGEVVDLKTMLDEYYTARGWDLKTGIPTREKLEQLGLAKVANDLEKI